MNIHKYIIILIATLVFMTKGLADGLTARVNTNTVTEGDVFQLTLSSDGNAESPDLAPLQSDFDVLGTSRQISVSNINGRSKRLSEWVVSLSPKRKGDLIIPSIKAGKSSSDKINIRVVDASLAPKQQGASDGISITMRINSESEKFYVFQDIPITIRIETSRPILSANIYPPKIIGAELTQTGGDRQSQMRNGRRTINIVERDYTLSTEKEGEIELDPFIFKGEVPDTKQYRRDPFAEFDSFFGERSPFGGRDARGKPFAVRSNSLKLRIEGKENTDSNEWFLPAKLVELQSKWMPSDPTFKQGEAVTRTVDLVATGARPEQLPKLEFKKPEGAKLYVDNDVTTMLRDTGKGAQALRKITLSIVPTRSGEVTLPEVRVKWLNTKTNQTEVATLSSEVIQVAEGVGVAASDRKENANSPTEIDSDSEINEPSFQIMTSPSSFIEQYGIWLLVSITLIILTFILVLVALRMKNLRNDSIVNQKKQKQKDLRLQLNDALKARDEKALYQSLIDWRIQDATLKENAQIALLLQQLEDRLYCSKTRLMAINFQNAKKHINQHLAQLDKKILGNNNVLPKLYDM